MNTTTIYIHFPFCLSRCNYCTFYSGEDHSYLEKYPELIAREISLLPVDTKVEVTSIYLGGGTPTLVGSSGIGEILSAVKSHFKVKADAEITCETNPALENDFSGLAKAGVNRLSVGVQALDDDLLKTLGREHSAKEARAAIASGIRAGRSITADLIYGYHGIGEGKLADWAKELVAMGVNHLSLYSYEDPKKPLSPAPADIETEEAQWQEISSALIGEGLECYEVSNFARPGFESRHNRGYWSGSSYIGLGPGGHGFDASRGEYGSRIFNLPDISSYADALYKGIKPPHSTERLSREEALLERLFLALRQHAPIDPSSLAKEFSLEKEALGSALLHLSKNGDLTIEGGKFTPTLACNRRADGLSLWLVERITK